MHDRDFTYPLTHEALYLGLPQVQGFIDGGNTVGLATPEAGQPFARITLGLPLNRVMFPSRKPPGWFTLIPTQGPYLSNRSQAMGGTSVESRSHTFPRNHPSARATNEDVTFTHALKLGVFSFPSTPKHTTDSPNALGASGRGS